MTTDPLFELPTDAYQVGGSDEHYTPRWVFDAMGLQFDIDVPGAAGGGGDRHRVHLLRLRPARRHEGTTTPTGVRRVPGRRHRTRATPRRRRPLRRGPVRQTMTRRRCGHITTSGRCVWICTRKPHPGDPSHYYILKRKHP